MRHLDAWTVVLVLVGAVVVLLDVATSFGLVHPDLRVNQTNGTINTVLLIAIALIVRDATRRRPQ